MTKVDQIGPIVIYQHRNGHFILHNTKKSFNKGHTHLKSRQRSYEVAENVIKKHFPLHWSNYFIESMIRLTTDEKFIERLEHLRETRKGKDKYYYYYNRKGGG